MKDCILLRYGEVGLKSKRTRTHIEKSYISAIKDALKRNGYKDTIIDNYGGRFVVYIEKEAADVLKRVAGVHGVSAAKKFSFKTKKDILEKAAKFGKDVVKNKRFAVKVKRIGFHDFDSVGLAKEVGSALYNYSKGVDLTNPEATIYLEIRNKDCFFYTENIQGVGGLPLNNSDKVLCLFSGGIDSPVAAFELIKRGCKVDFLLVNLVGEQYLSDVSKIYNFLSSRYAFGYTPRIFVVDGKNIVKKLKSKTPDDLRQIAFKIVLYKIGEQIARKYDYLALAGGESLSQKSSQTLRSLIFIEKQISISMLRPLLTLDKIDIMKIARELNTFFMSEKIKEYCNLSEGPVTTAPREEDLEKLPDLEKEIKEAVKEVSITKGTLSVEETTSLKLKKGFVSVDIRESNIVKKFSLKTDLKIPYSEIFNRLDEFKQKNLYLLICEFGVRSEDVAVELRKKDIKAAGISVANYLNFFKK
ncbi:MAG: THUMP domain-containing protein [archaeon]